ncbi:MAG: hypothetical protein WC696_01460 [Candidatus Methylopumilus sp.]|jgi:hypothetical protein
MEEQVNQLPQGWAKDALTQFISYAQNNEVATFSNLSDFFDVLINVDAVLLDSSQYCLLQQHKPNPSIGFLLYINAHMHFRALVRMVTSGQCLSAYPLGRAALEGAVYGWYLVSFPDAEKLWHNKPNKNDKDGLRKWGRSFSFSNIKRLITEKDADLGRMIEYINEEAIELGAHPNQTSLYSNFEIKMNPAGARVYSMNCLHRHGLLMARTIMFAIEVGIAQLRLISSINEEIENLFHLEGKIQKLFDEFESIRPKLEEFGDLDGAAE